MRFAAALPHQFSSAAPLDWPGTTGNVVADALTSTSMSSKYGARPRARLAQLQRTQACLSMLLSCVAELRTPPSILPWCHDNEGSMQKTAGGMVQITTPGMSQQAAAASRRRLAQLSMGNTLSVNQTIIPNPTVPIPLTGYQRELANVNNLTQTVIANAIPGLLPSQIAVTVRTHGLSSNEPPSEKSTTAPCLRLCSLRILPPSAGHRPHRQGRHLGGQHLLLPVDPDPPGAVPQRRVRLRHAERRQGPDRGA